MPYFLTPPAPIDEAPELHCLLVNLIPSEILAPFRAANISKTLIKKIKNFYSNSLLTSTKTIIFYNALWQLRSVQWKDWKHIHAVTKKTFSSYRKRKRRDDNSHLNIDNTRTRINDTHGYINPYNNTRRALDITPFYGFISQVQTSSIIYLGYYI